VGDALSPLTGRIDGVLHRELTAMKDHYRTDPGAQSEGPFAPRFLARLQVHHTCRSPPLFS